ncbi:MAG: DUF4843 domain-containing protein [Paraprevotella sp.]|nr:DUF4843 domain-containing protein [Paraprevotella sp.]
MKMKIYQILKVCLGALSVLWICASCSETDYLVYDTSRSGIYFTKDTLTYSFGVTPVEQRTTVFRIPGRIMGTLSDADRTFAYEVIADSTTAVEGVQYNIGKPVIPADSINGYIPVELLRDGLAGDYQNGYVSYKLGVRLLNGDGFEPTLDEASQIRVLTFDNAVEQPDWLNANGEKVWYTSTWGVWHPLKLIKMVEYFHAIKDVLPEIYVKMVALYGENLENVPYGDFYVYGTIMKKYVYEPMYEYFSDPANRDEILSLYPDFPFDFPNPYA